MPQIMKKIVLLILIASASVAAALGQSTSPMCNDAFITGVYGFTIEGAKLTGSPSGPQVGVAMTEFYGDGTLQQIDSVTINGTQNPNAGSFTEPTGPTKGTYKVNPDCTGTFTLNFTDGRPTVVTDFVIVDNGNEIDTVVIGIILPGDPAIQGGALATRSIGKRRFTLFFGPGHGREPR